MGNLQVNLECLEVIFFGKGFKKGNRSSSHWDTIFLKEVLYLGVVSSPSSCFATTSLELGFCPQVLRCLAEAEMVRFGAHAKRKIRLVELPVNGRRRGKGHELNSIAAKVTLLRISFGSRVHQTID